MSVAGNIVGVVRGDGQGTIWETRATKMMAILKSKMMAFFEWFEEHHGALGAGFTIVVAVVGGLYILFQYWKNQEDDRKKLTLEYVRLIQTGSAAQAKRAFDVHWLENSKDIEELVHTHDEKRFGEIAKDLDDKLQNDKGLTESMITLYYFYYDVSACVNLGLCDTDTACAYFAGDVSSLNAMYDRFVTSWNDAWGRGMAREIDRFVKRCG